MQTWCLVSACMVHYFQGALQVNMHVPRVRQHGGSGVHRKWPSAAWAPAWRSEREHLHDAQRVH